MSIGILSAFLLGDFIFSEILMVLMQCPLCNSLV